MESSGFYTAAEIDKLKQKVIAYKSLLTTLKLGASLEDYLSIKSEFEELKMQMSQVESLKDNVDKNESEPIEEHDNQAKQFSVQLTSLNQRIEQVLATLNKVVIGEEKKEQVEEKKSPHKITQVDEAKSHDKPIDNVISQPTYSQLRNLAGQVVYQPKNEEPIQTIQNNNYPLDSQHEQRHFNHRYFQSLNTQPSNIHNGLYRNMHMKASSQLKDAVQGTKRRNDMINGLVAPSRLPNFLDRSNIQPVISNEGENKDIYMDKLNSAILGPAEQPPSLENTSQLVKPSVAPAVTPQLTEQPPSLESTSQLVKPSVAPTVTPQLMEQSPSLESTSQLVKPSVAPIVTSQLMEQSPSLENTTQSAEQLQQPTVTSEQIEQSQAPIVTSEQTEQQSKPIIQSEETLSSEVEQKKQKSSSFFGFFRK